MRAPSALLFTALLSIPLLMRAATEPVKVEGGLITGAVDRGVRVFKGIPYAAPPVASLRWKPPQPLVSWSGVRDASVFGAECPQTQYPSASIYVRPLQRQGEDCLFVNVWTTATAAARQPVLVWIHGGALTHGSGISDTRDGVPLARKGVVLVSLNYRLGPLGYLAHPELSAESPHRSSGNYGVLDQIAALQWVQRNIAAFGGDSKNVTLFGESAGGGSVNTLMISPLAKGLFQKAICESGGGRANGPMAAPTLQTAEAAGVALAKLVGVSGDDAAALVALRQLPAADLVRGLNLMSMGQQRDSYSGPLLDGKIAPEPVEDAFRAGRQARIPYMIGANNREFGFLAPPPAAVDGMLARFGADKDKVLAAYDPAGTGDKGEVGVGLSSDGAMVEPARMLARLTAAAGQPTYAYRFSYVASSLRSSTKGALHATEIPFVFATVRAKYADATTAEDEALAAQANAYWAAFAKSGDPNAEGLPKWPAFTAAGDVVMDLGASGSKAGPDPWKARLDFIERAAQAPPQPRP
jgi:para-nitrobenzyl esterase